MGALSCTPYHLFHRTHARSIVRGADVGLWHIHCLTMQSYMVQNDDLLGEETEHNLHATKRRNKSSQSITFKFEKDSDSKLYIMTLTWT